jgi:hypothetical protein
MPYASASGRSVYGRRTGCPADTAGRRCAGKDERGDMTRQRGTLPPVVSAMSFLPDPPRTDAVFTAADDADR